MNFVLEMRKQKKFHANEIELKKMYKVQTSIVAPDISLLEDKFTELANEVDSLKINVKKLEDFIKNIRSLQTNTD